MEPPSQQRWSSTKVGKSIKTSGDRTGLPCYMSTVCDGGIIAIQSIGDGFCSKNF